LYSRRRHHFASRTDYRAASPRFRSTAFFSQPPLTSSMSAQAERARHRVCAPWRKRAACVLSAKASSRPLRRRQMRRYDAALMPGQPNFSSPGTRSAAAAHAMRRRCEVRKECLCWSGYAAASAAITTPHRFDPLIHRHLTLILHAWPIPPSHFPAHAAFITHFLHFTGTLRHFDTLPSILHDDAVSGRFSPFSLRLRRRFGFADPSACAAAVVTTFAYFVLQRIFAALRVRQARVALAKI